jgi:hypothetical protein
MTDLIEVPPWYTPEIEKLNDKLWVPDKVVPNNTLLYNFDSKIVNFNAYKNNIHDEIKINIVNEYHNSLLLLNEESTNKNREHNNYIKSTYKVPLNAKLIDAYLNDPIIKEYKLYESNIKKIRDKLYADYRDKINRLTLQIKPIIYNNYKDNANNLKKKYHEKNLKILLKIIVKQKKKTENTNNIATCIIEKLPHDMNEHAKNQLQLNKDIKNLRESIYNLDEKYIKDVKMINKGIRAYKTKLKFNDTQKNIILKWMYEAERLYNFCVYTFNNDSCMPKNYQDGKMYIFKKLYKPKKPAPYDMLTYAVKVFYDNLSSNFSSVKNGTKKRFEMHYINNREHMTITLNKNFITNNGVCPRLLKINNTSKKLGDIVICDCKLTYDKLKGSFYLYMPQYRTFKETDLNKNSICALDPGEKVFMTYYSLDDYGYIGNDIRKPLLKNLEKIQKYQRLLVQTPIEKYKIKKVNTKGKKKDPKNNKYKSINRSKIKKKIKKLSRCLI